ncbi:hypothetical protein COLO4_01715 [Corchorus olitorius]|uniref:Uncharacterized protein n=1 Tax=Corchorus olitorius TaxID=93759 RepID=A0A1R3L254_9ROSI|nr:hypothetical protein COLO4_01715 [Corchorus olitorius]
MSKTRKNEHFERDGDKEGNRRIWLYLSRQTIVVGTCFNE